MVENQVFLGGVPQVPSDAQQLASQVWDLVSEHPIATTGVVIGGIAAAGLIAKGMGPKVEEQIATAIAYDRPANIFSMIRKSEAELNSIASTKAGIPLYRVSDTTMSLNSPSRWDALVRAAGHDHYNSEVLKTANVWGTEMEKRMAAGEPLDMNLLNKVSIELNRPELSFGTIKCVLYDHWKYVF